MEGWGFAVVLLLSWAIPLYAVIYNQSYPSYESALGVAYGFLAGSVVHFVLLLLWMAVRRKRLQKVEVITLLISFAIMLVLTALSDAGWLSRLTG